MLYLLVTEAPGAFVSKTKVAFKYLNQTLPPLATGGGIAAWGARVERSAISEYEAAFSSYSMVYIAWQD